MLAWVLREKTGIEGLRLESIPENEPSSRELKIAIEATALNRADLLQCEGRYPAPAPTGPFELPGLELAGKIMSVGDEVRDFSVGDRVMALVSEGAWAESICVDSGLCLPIPPQLDPRVAGGFMEAAITTWDALVRQGELKPGAKAYLTVAASGVASFAAKLAHALGAEVAASASAAKWETLPKLPVALAIDSDQDDCGARIATWAPEGVDFILDCLGGSYVNEHLKYLAPRGAIVVLAFLAGRKSEIDLARLMGRRARLFGSVLRSRGLDEKRALVKELGEFLVGAGASADLAPVLHSAYEFAKLPEALHSMQNRENAGKILIQVSDV